MQTVSVIYVGPYDQVEVPFDGGWLTIDRGVAVDVPRTLAEGGTDVDIDAGVRVETNIGGLLAQPENWQLAPPSKPKSKPKSAPDVEPTGSEQE